MDHPAYIWILMNKVYIYTCAFLFSGVIRRWGEAPTTVLPIIQKLLTGGLRIWIYRYITYMPCFFFTFISHSTYNKLVLIGLILVNIVEILMGEFQ